MSNMCALNSDSLPIESTSSTAESRDINKIFDEIALSEEKISEESYKKGYEAGAAEGNTEGYHLGYHRGAELGSELGYYYGFILKHSANTDTLSDRTKKAVELSLELISQFPRTNEETIDIFKLVDNIRAQYKKTCALLKVNGKHPETDTLNF